MPEVTTTHGLCDSVYVLSFLPVVQLQLQKIKDENSTTTTTTTKKGMGDPLPLLCLLRMHFVW